MAPSCSSTASIRTPPIKIHVFLTTLLSSTLLHQLAMAAAASSTLQTYIVHTPSHMKPSVFASTKTWHASILSSVMDPSAGLATERLLHSYATTMHGFAARMTEKESEKMRNMEGVAMMRKDRMSQLQTTRTPSFLGLRSSGESRGLWRAAKQGEDIIVGLLDTGIWPERSSYDDTGFTAIPTRWKGTCESGPGFTSSLCNRKLIGARSFYKGYEASVGSMNETLELKSARDTLGHGTHTSSTAAGSVVQNASLSGLALGTASGISPLSRLAVYKVCWIHGCFDSDMLAAFEAAISDGVDVISISIGSRPSNYFRDAIAIGSFAAMAAGIITSCSAGNSGPGSRTVLNVAPWIFTIAASSIDREFPAPVTLGNGVQLRGDSLYQGEGEKLQELPLIYGRDAVANGSYPSFASLCHELDAAAVKGKMVVCDRGGNTETAKGLTVKQAGGLGMIVANEEAFGDSLLADYHVLPATHVGFATGEAIKQYINSTANPTARLSFQGTKLGTKRAPAIPSFSSRGPNSLTPEILKPDVTAPGVNILAAWTGFTAPSNLVEDDRRAEFNIVSGTSMSCPHVAGVTALLKAAHPTWSPAAIRSAIMTSTTTIDKTGKPITDIATEEATVPTVYGAGHIHPNAALNPGLIYDITPQDYVDFLCSLNYTNTMLSVFVNSYDCNNSTIAKPGDLNYPSFSAVYKYNKTENGSSYEETLKRTLTNVGPAKSTYRVSVTSPNSVNVSVEPATLSFGYTGEKLSYNVTFRAGPAAALTYDKSSGYEEALSFGSLVWSDGYHIVKSPISFMWQSKT